MKKTLFVGLLLVLSLSPKAATQAPSLPYAISTCQNRRPYQEDRFFYGSFKEGHFFGIYDGHGGDKVSTYLQKTLHTTFINALAEDHIVHNAFEYAFLQAEKHVLQHFSDGSTALVAFIDEDKVLHCAWTGDSRLVLEKDGVVVFQTKDHKPNDPQELMRIISCGGHIKKYGVWRVAGLAISRCVGDVAIKEDCPGQVIAVAEYTQVKIDQHNHFIIMASDGLWDTISSQEAVDMVADGLKKGDTLQSITHYLQNTAIARGSSDNITVCVIPL